MLSSRTRVGGIAFVTRSLRVVATLMSNESAWSLQTDSDPENIKETVWRDVLTQFMGLVDLTDQSLELSCCLWTSSLSISSSTQHSLTMPFLVVQSSNRSSTFNSDLHTFPHPVIITYPYHLNLPLLMTVEIGSTPARFLNSLLVSWKRHPSI